MERSAESRCSEAAGTRNAAHFLRCLPFSAPIVFAPFEWREKLRVETSSFSIVIVRRRRTIFSGELFFEAGFQQPFAHSRFFLFELAWYGHIAIQCRQRKIVEFPRAGIETIQSMCPSPDENDLTKPGFNRAHEFRKRFEFRILFDHGSDDSSAEDRIFLQIRSACSLPRDGCCLKR